MQDNGTGPQDATTVAPPSMTPATGTPQGAGVTNQAAGVTNQAAGATNQAAGATNQAAGATNQAAGVPNEAAGVPLQPSAPARSRRLTTFTTNASIERRLLAAQIAIESVLADPAQLAALDACGYDLAEIQQGKALYEHALALVQQRRAASGDKLTATDARNAVQQQAHALYMRHISIARVALRGDRGAAEKLDLKARKQTQAGWLLQARQFYTNALGDEAIIARLARYRLTQEQLLEGQRQVELVADEGVARKSRKDNARQTRKARDAALDALNSWMRDFREIARVALAEQPQARNNLRG